jgi:hypothetical protein
MPKVFRIFGGCGTLVLHSSAKPSNILAMPNISAFGGFGIPENAQAALAKISIRSQYRQIH